MSILSSLWHLLFFPILFHPLILLALARTSSMILTSMTNGGCLSLIADLIRFFPKVFFFFPPGHEAQLLGVLDSLELGRAMLLVWANELEVELMSQFWAKNFIVTATYSGLFLSTSDFLTSNIQSQPGPLSYCNEHSLLLISNRAWALVRR